MTDRERIREFLSQFKDCSVDVKVIHDACRFVRDITNDQHLSCIVELFRNLLERGLDPDHAKICMAPELEDALFPDYDVIVIDGYPLYIIADPTLIVLRHGNGSLSSDIWIGNVQICNVRIEGMDDA